MSRQSTSGGFPMARGVQLSKELSFEVMRAAAAQAQLDKFWADTFLTNAGINSGTSTGYTYRGASNYDVIKSSASSDSIPAMTSASAPAGYVVTPSSEYSVTRGWWAFADDGITNTFNFSATTGTLKVQIPVAKAFTSCNIKVQTVGRAPYNFTIEASNTGAFSGEEVTLRTVTGETSWTTDVYKNYTWTNSTAYLYYRINVTLSGGASGLCEIAEMEYFEDAPASAVVKSITLTMPSAITSAIVWANTSGGNPTLVRISTDSGSTWTTIATAQLGQIVAVPSGTGVILEVTIAAAVELESWGVAGV